MVQRITRQAGLDAFIKAVEQDGCVIIQDFTDAESLDQAQLEVQPYLDESAASRSIVGALNGGTATCTRLIGRSKTVREKFFSDTLYQVTSSTLLPSVVVDLTCVRTLLSTSSASNPRTGTATSPRRPRRTPCCP